LSFSVRGSSTPERLFSPPATLSLAPSFLNRSEASMKKRRVLLFFLPPVADNRLETAGPHFFRPSLGVAFPPLKCLSAPFPSDSFFLAQVRHAPIPPSRVNLSAGNLGGPFPLFARAFSFLFPGMRRYHPPFFLFPNAFAEKLDSRQFRAFPPFFVEEEQIRILPAPSPLSPCLSQSCRR